MINLIKNEIFKVFRLKKLYIFILITIGLTIIQAVSFMILKNTPGQIPPDYKAIIDNLNGQSFPLLMLSGLPQMIIIFMAILLGDIVSDEYKNGTMKLSLLRPVGRIQLINSKIAALFVSLVVLLGVTLIVSYVTGTAFFGWGDKTVVNGITFETARGIAVTLQSYFLSLLPYMAFGIMIVFFSVMFSSMGATIGISLGVMIALTFVEFIKQVKDYSIYHQLSYFYTYFFSDIVWKDVFTGIATILGYIAVFYLGSITVFKKKDILS